MFESEFTNRQAWELEQDNVQGIRSKLEKKDVLKTQLLYWREHCLECAPPDCYHSCHLYSPRFDKRCVRLRYGIYQNEDFKGLFDFGADIRFEPWAKLGTELYRYELTPRRHETLSKIDFLSSRIVNLVFRILESFNPMRWLKTTPHNPQKIIFKTYSFLHNKILHRLRLHADNAKLDCFVIECYSFEKEPFNLQLEYTDSIVRYRNVYRIEPGQNYFETPLEDFNGESNPLAGSLMFYPENDMKVRVVFTWLDFVELNKDTRARVDRIESKRPAEKIKCLAWDLDNTLWDGILIEDGKENIAIREEAVKTIKALDERGVIQTIISKNNHDAAKELLDNFGLTDYFIYPAINWAPKSSNLKQIAKLININIDTFALIDDSAFERAEVSSTFLQVRVYSDKEMSKLLEYPEFDLPTTEASKLRRKSYLTQMKREKVKETYGADYDSFLRSCRMKMLIFIPQKKEHIDRCYEMIQRSNQLNLSTHRYSFLEFKDLLSNKEMLCMAFHCKDRFGDYGIVGFASVDQAHDEPRLIDFVISCRVAQKMVEQTFFECLALWGSSKGYNYLNASLIKSKRNGPLVQIFQSLPFEVINETGEAIEMRLPFAKIKSRIDIIQATFDL